MQKINTLSLVNSLHSAHEKIEELLLANRCAEKQLRAVTGRIERILANHPDYWDYETIEISYNSRRNDKKIVGLRFFNLDLSVQLLEQLYIEIEVQKNITSLIISSDQSDPHLPFRSWPFNLQPEIKLSCAGNYTEISPQIAQALSGLCTKDWKTLRALTGMLATIFADPPDTIKSLDIDLSEISSQLKLQALVYASWPNTLRFDSVRMIEAMHGQNYHVLYLELANLYISNTTHLKAEFGLATVDSDGSSFGSNPRLEFPEACREIMESWHPESANEKGQKLELRFAFPNAMDTNVWNSLTINDKFLITGIIGKLPEMVNKISTEAPTKSLRWGDWKELASNTRQIFISNMTAANTAKAKK